MQLSTFPFVALTMGIGFVAGLIATGALSPDGEQAIPLLTTLIVSEFSMFLTGIGAYIGIRDLLARGVRLSMLLATVGCAVLAPIFLYLGMQHWPG
ncbi:MAG TPA: hypothetical protein EYN73_02445 [Chromatiaceae bacterium]|jgi:hypothetical protein|nr:hypothetical protein [Chromatiaceae bacterium]HIN81413.1 hypothetical protein [Chromatiales bacterium]HIA07938.1 hypothetical protein [Chromatiaceae bacterium]HIB84984.1 hypothetical protein [Chromatiaceae bacterium]HIO14701.1 hypothetical protein [Chromatiales bacterium]